MTKFIDDRVNELATKEQEIVDTLRHYWDDYDLDELCGIIYYLTEKELLQLKGREYAKVVINYEYDRLTYFNLIKDWCELKTDLVKVKTERKRYERLTTLTRKQIFWIVKHYFRMRVDALVNFGVPITIKNLCSIIVRRIDDDWAPEENWNKHKPLFKAVNRPASAKAKQDLLDSGYTEDQLFSNKNLNGKKYHQYYEDPYRIKYSVNRTAHELGQAFRAYTCIFSDQPNTQYGARILYTTIRENPHLIVNFK